MKQFKTRTAHAVTVRTVTGETFELPAGSLVTADPANVSGVSHSTRTGGGYDATDVFNMDAGVKVPRVRVVTSPWN